MYRITVSLLPLLRAHHHSLPSIDGFNHQPAHLPQTPAARAAGIARGAMLFRQNLRSGQLAPDAIKDTQLCMDTYRSVAPYAPPTSSLILQFSWMFDCCRVPGTQGVDWSVSYAGSTNPHDDLGHIIVMRKNRFWKIKAEVGGKVVGMGDLIRCSLSSRDSHVGDMFSKMHSNAISCKVLLFSFLR